MHTVFVYGTLRSGFSNHFLMASTVKIGDGETKNKYALYTSGIPFLVEDEQVSTIKGEVYFVDDTILRVLDSLEGHPDWYKRKLIPVVVKGKEYIAWAYFNKPAGVLIESGDYEKQLTTQTKNTKYYE